LWDAKTPASCDEKGKEISRVKRRSKKNEKFFGNLQHKRSKGVKTEVERELRGNCKNIPSGYQGPTHAEGTGIHGEFVIRVSKR